MMKIPFFKKWKVPTLPFRLRFPKPKGIWALMLPVFSRSQSILHNAASTLDLLKVLVLVLSVITAYYAMPGHAGTISAVTVLASDPVGFLFLVLGYAFMSILIMSILSGKSLRPLMKGIRLRFAFKYFVLTIVCFGVVAVLYFYSYERSRDGGVIYLTSQVESKHKPPQTKAQIVVELEAKYSGLKKEHLATKNKELRRVDSLLSVNSIEEQKARSDSSNYVLDNGKKVFGWTERDKYRTKAKTLKLRAERALDDYRAAISSDSAQRMSELPFLVEQANHEWQAYNQKLMKAEQTAKIGVGAFTIVGLVLTTLSSIFRADAFRQYARDLITKEAERVRLQRSGNRAKTLAAVNKVLETEKVDTEKALNVSRDIGYNQGFIEKAEKGIKEVQENKANQGKNKAEEVVSKYKGENHSSSTPEAKPMADIVRSKLQRLYRKAANNN